MRHVGRVRTLRPRLAPARILDLVTLTPQAWSDEVRDAAIAGDRDALRRLFEDARELFGDDAGARWAEAVSGLDASAQTG